MSENIEQITQFGVWVARYKGMSAYSGSSEEAEKDLEILKKFYRKSSGDERRLLDAEDYETGY